MGEVIQVQEEKMNRLLPKKSLILVGVILLAALVIAVNLLFGGKQYASDRPSVAIEQKQSSSKRTDPDDLGGGQNRPRKTGVGEHEIPAALKGNIHITAFDFDKMKSRDDQLGIIGMGAKKAEKLEHLMLDLQSNIADSETKRFNVLAQDERSVIVGIPGGARMVEVEKELIENLKEISGKNYDILKCSIWPDLEVLTGDFGVRDRVLYVFADGSGNYIIKYLDFAPGNMPSADEIKKTGFQELRRGAYSSHERVVDKIPAGLAHIFQT
jgi:hypothetical protein